MAGLSAVRLGSVDIMRHNEPLTRVNLDQQGGRFVPLRLRRRNAISSVIRSCGGQANVKPKPKK